MNHLLKKSLLISLSLHILFASMIIVTFPVHMGDQYPFFVFLGSILSHQDFSQFNSLGPADSIALNQKDIHIEFKDSQYEFLATPSLNKPSLSPNTKKIRRTYPKFFEKNEKSSEAPEMLSDKSLQEYLGIDLESPARTPIQLRYFE